MNQNPQRGRNSSFLAVILISVLAMLSMAACTTLEGPIKAAESAEQKAFALYGTFIVFEEQAVSLVRDSRINIEARRAVQRADAVAKPLVDSMVEVALEVRAIRQELGDTDRLEVVTLNLETWILRAEPAIISLTEAVRNAK